MTRQVGAGKMPLLDWRRDSAGCIGLTHCGGERVTEADMPRGDEEMARVDRIPFMAALNNYVQRQSEKLRIFPPEQGTTKWFDLVAKQSRVVSRATLQKMVGGDAVSAKKIERLLECLEVPALRV